MSINRLLTIAALGLLACSDRQAAAEADRAIAELRLDCDRGYVGGWIDIPDAGSWPVQPDEQGVWTPSTLELMLVPEGVGRKDWPEPLRPWDDHHQISTEIYIAWDWVTYIRKEDRTSAPAEAWVYVSPEITVAQVELVLGILAKYEVPTKLVLSRPGPPGSREYQNPELAKELLDGGLEGFSIRVGERLIEPAKVCPPVWEAFARAAALEHGRPQCLHVVEALEANRASCPRKTDWPLITTLVAVSSRGELEPRTRVLVPIDFPTRPSTVKPEARWGDAAASWIADQRD
jgi:hypothetical protein